MSWNWIRKNTSKIKLQRDIRYKQVCKQHIWTFNKVDNVFTKTCHCAEQNYVQGASMGQLGQDVGQVYLQFYKNGTFDSQKMKSWSDMNYDAFNIISNDERLWTQEAINNWDICNVSFSHSDL